VAGTVPPQPTITSVSPSPLVFGATGGILTINGYGFSVYSGTTLTINFDSSSITATGSVVAGSDTQIIGLIRSPATRQSEHTTSGSASAAEATA
jgi:hypothetical protein